MFQITDPLIFHLSTAFHRQIELAFKPARWYSQQVANGQKRCSRSPVARKGGVCYSLEVVDEQWSLPVAVGPARTGKREAGSLGRVGDKPWTPVGNPTENKPLQDPGVDLPWALSAQVNGVRCSPEFFESLRSANQSRFGLTKWPKFDMIKRFAQKQADVCSRQQNRRQAQQVRGHPDDESVTSIQTARSGGHSQGSLTIRLNMPVVRIRSGLA